MRRSIWSPAAPARSAGSSSPRLRDAGRDGAGAQPHAAAERRLVDRRPDHRRGRRRRGARASTSIVHCAGSQQGRRGEGPHLVQAAARAGAPHLVYISVVGADRVPVVSGVDRAMFGYFASKLAAERVVAESGLPWTTLRATQFHDLMLTTARQMAKLPVVPVPPGSGSSRSTPTRWRTGSSSSRSARPAGLVPDIAGPRVYAMGDLVRGYLRARGKHRPLVPSGSRARPPARSGPARTWPPTARSAGGPGRSSSRRAGDGGPCGRPRGAGTARCAHPTPEAPVTLTDFTDEQRTRLKRAPFVAGMAISLADPGGPIEAVKETTATLQDRAGGRRAGGHGELVGEIAREIVEEPRERKNPLAGFKPTKGAARGRGDPRRAARGQRASCRRRRRRRTPRPSASGC